MPGFQSGFQSGFQGIGGAGGASYTLSCVTGAYSITGASAALRASRRVAAAQGSYVITGQPAATTAARRMMAATGSYSITGNAANLIYVPPGVVLPAAAGSYALTGNDVVMRATRRMLAESGAYTITGNAVTNPGEEVAPPSGGGGGVSGGAGSLREVRAFADLLDKSRPTKAAKKRLRRVLEVEALELLPDEPEAIKAAQEIAAVVAKKELQAIERRPVNAAPLKALPFDPSEMIRQMVEEWLQNEAIRQELEDEEEAEMLLMG